MSYDRMGPEEERLQQEIDELLKQAQSTDDAEDARHGKDRTGEEIPDELARRESRLEKIKQAKAALEEQAKAKAREHAAQLEAEGKTPRKNPEAAVPDAKAQRNFTNPDSKIMKTSNKGFDQCGNAQAVVNDEQIIIAADVTNQANDVQQVIPMLGQARGNLEATRVRHEICALHSGMNKRRQNDSQDPPVQVDAASLRKLRQFSWLLKR